MKLDTFSTPSSTSMSPSPVLWVLNTPYLTPFCAASHPLTFPLAYLPEEIWRKFPVNLDKYDDGWPSEMGLEANRGKSDNERMDIIGCSTSMIYAGTPRTIAAIHREDVSTVPS